MIWLVLLALFIGALLPLQAGINAQMRVGVGHAGLAAFVSFVIGSLGLLAYSVAVRAPLPDGATLARMPWWQWTGGLLGAVYVALAIVLAPRLGAATLIAAVVAGQMVASVALDHFGLVGFTAHPATLWRLVGVALVVGGVILIQRS